MKNTILTFALLFFATVCYAAKTQAALSVLEENVKDEVGSLIPPISVKVNAPGTLSKLLTEQQQDTCRHLIVSGKINSEDIRVLRRMAGADGRGQLCLLDLTNVKFASSDTPYLVVHNAEEKIIPWISESRIYYSDRIYGLNDANLTSVEKQIRMDEVRYAPSFSNGAVRCVNFMLYNQEDYWPAEFLEQYMPIWKRLVISRLNTKGHDVSYKNGHYTYYAFTRKGLFSWDMFYACPNLLAVILPQRGKANNKVIVRRDPIQYKLRIIR